jgi:rfaE bifunctional protein nucleotidyltransferase chain/domain
MYKGVSGKIVTLQTASLLAAQNKQAGKKIVLATGNYDIFHPGHLFFLEDASKFGDVLIAGIASDQLIKQSKDPNRPIFNENDRAIIVAALEAVNYVLIFSDIYELIKVILPNVLVVSPTSNEKYNAKKIALANRLGIEIKMIPSRHKLHTSDIIAKIKSLKSI